MSQGDPYVYPGSNVLRNKLGLIDQQQLDFHEREFVTLRMQQGVPKGRFNLAHLRAIHRHLFQDIYPWAGQIRTVEITKGASQFQFRRFIETGMADIHRRLVQSSLLRALERDAFAKAAGEIMGDVNYVHPFREGNGRTQLLYLEQLAAQAGHPLDLTRIDPRSWINSSRAAHLADDAPMAADIAAAIIEDPS